MFSKFYKTCLTLHTTGINTKYLGRYKLLFAISNAVKKDIAKRSNHNLKCELVYNGIQFNCIENYTNSKGIITPFKIVQVGRLDHEVKGQHLLLNAIAMLKEDVEVVFIGGGDSIEYLTLLATELDIRNKVVFMGNKSRKYINSHLKFYDLLVQPSLQEGFGLSIVEGMAAKIPVLVSDIEGPMEVINNGEFGYYFKSGNVTELVNTIKKVIGDYKSGAIDQKINNSYTYAYQKFSINNTALNYIHKYQQFNKE